MILGGFRRGFDALVRRESEQVDLASLAVFRILFGALAAFGAFRFLANGWVERFFVRPDFYFKYWGFEWVQVGPPWMMHAAFWALGILGLMIAVGFLYRYAIVLFFVLFTYVELLDVSNYLNHYYLVSLLALLMCFMPLNRMWSVDAKIWPRIRRATTARLSLDILRIQVACVYFYAGLAKFSSDWLIDAQPLNIWLTSRVDTPLIGPILGEWWVALAMAWGGFLFDTTIVLWLSLKKTRPWAYAVLVVFHLMTHVFFAIGLFPLIMIVSATVFFDPDWPRRFTGRVDLAKGLRPPSGRAFEVLVAAFVAFALIQITLPLRHLAYPGDVLWSEEGMRWSWKVMVREKNGDVTYRVRIPEISKTLEVTPSKYLSADQEREFASQPDLILQLGKHIGEQWNRQGYDVEVRVDAWASLNGRTAARLIDPKTDLMRLNDGLEKADWILPAPQTEPARLVSK